jgi:C4-type Zn-finger protein
MNDNADMIEYHFQNREVSCPFCESTDVSLEMPFGGSVSEMLFRCAKCRTFFHWIKWRPEAAAPT